MQRIGVFVCHCGTNIAATVDVKKVVEMAAKEPGVGSGRDRGKISTEVRLDKRREKLRVYLRCPYRKPTQVGRKKILRPTGEGLLRNSAS